MSVVDVYVTPDEENLSFDDAETGVRTLLQNQPDGGFLGRMRASSIAKMIVDRPVSGPGPGSGQGIPWIEVRRRILTGDHRATREVVGNAEDQLGDENVQAVRKPAEKNAAKLAVTRDACGDVIDAGTTFEHLDRILEVYTSNLGHDMRSRRFASAMSPLALPEAIGGVEERTSQLYRSSDVEALSTSVCSLLSPFQVIRILAKDTHAPADSVLQRGIAFMSSLPTLPIRTASQSVLVNHKMIEGSTFDLVKYITHALTLTPGDIVTAMLDVPTTSTEPQVTEWRGKVLQVTKRLITVKLDNGVKVLTNSDGHVHINLENIPESDGFVYGVEWNGQKFSKTVVSTKGHHLTLIPWTKTKTGSETDVTSQTSLIRSVQPDAVHVALGLTMSVWNTSVESLFDKDDVSLDVRETDIVAVLIQKAIKIVPTASDLNTNASVSGNNAPVDRATLNNENHVFLLALKEWSDNPKTFKQIGGKGRKQKAITEPKGLEKAAAEAEAKVPAAKVPESETCVWSPSSVLEGLMNQCVDATAGGSEMRGMGQGHITNLGQYVEINVPELSANVEDARGKRNVAEQLDTSNLAASTSTVLSRLAGGVLRLEEEIKKEISASAAARSHIHPSPFDVYRALDVARWVNEIVRPPTYDSYKGNAETAFEADIAATRVMYEERGFYHAFENLEAGKPTEVVVAQNLPSTPVLFDMLVEACDIQGLQEREIASVIRNTRHYRPEDETAVKIRKRIEMVKRARNRPEFKEKTFAERTALEKRLVERVRALAVRDHTVSVLHTLGAMLILMVNQGEGRITVNMHVVTTHGHTGSKKKGDAQSHVPQIASGVRQIVQALLPPEVDADEVPMASHVSAITDEILKIEEDKTANGVSLIVEEDRLDAVARPRAIRDTPWPHFRPLMSNVFERRRQGHKISSTLKDVADMQKPYLKAKPLIFKDEKRPAVHNVCCLYPLPGLDASQAYKTSQTTQATSQTYQASNRSSRASRAAVMQRPPITTVLKGTTAASHVKPVLMTRYVGPPQKLLPVIEHQPKKPSLTSTWMEDVLRSFLDANQSYASDDALSRITAGNSANNAKVAWSALSSQNLARFEEMCAKVGVVQERIEIIRNNLLVPTVSVDGKLIQEQQFHARLFLKGVVLPLFGRLSNNARGHIELDRDASRLNAIMGSHEPGADVTNLRSTLAAFGDVHASDLLMLASGPLDVTALRASVQLLMGVALTALWRILVDAGGGPLGASVVKPITLLSLDRLAMSLKFARSDETVTRLIQNQREDEKLRKIEIYNRIMPDDVEFVKELRMIKKDLATWDQIERAFATDANSAIKDTGKDKIMNDNAQEQAQEIGALGAYPDDDREVAEEDADQEMMDYAD